MSALGDFARITLEKAKGSGSFDPDEQAIIFMYRTYGDEYLAKVSKKLLKQETFLDVFVSFFGVYGCKKYSALRRENISQIPRKTLLSCWLTPIVATCSLLSLLNVGYMTMPLLWALAPLAGKINATKIKPKIEKYTEDLFIKDLESGVLIDRYINDLPSLAPVFALLGLLESVTSLKEKFIVTAQRQEQENAEKILKEGVVPEGRIRIKLKNGGP